MISDWKESNYVVCRRWEVLDSPLLGAYLPKQSVLHYCFHIAGDRRDEKLALLESRENFGNALSIY